MPRAKIPELRVLFDTSVLYTGSASDLVPQETAQIIKDNSHHQDLSIIWYLPDIVRHERQFQMQKIALELLPSVQKLERVLGHQLNITEAIIKQRIKDTVDTQLQELGFNILETDTDRVSWRELIYNACYRIPPFENGKSEKGFRDALIAEAFMQLVEDSPKTPKACRVVFVAGDRMLADTLRVRTKDVANVRISGSIEELKGLINTLIENVTEEFVAAWKAKAEGFFFERENSDCLYYKEKVGDRIREKFKEALESLPQGAKWRKNGQWLISSPEFVRKEQQRVFWSTRISVDAEAYSSMFSPAAHMTIFPGKVYSGEVKLEPDNLSVLGKDTIAISKDLQSIQLPPPHIEGVTLSGLTPPELTNRGIQYAAISDFYKSLVGKGKTVFDVQWSVLINTRGDFKTPRIESIKHVKTVWE